MWTSEYSRRSSAQRVGDWCMDDYDELDRKIFQPNPGEKGIQLCVTAYTQNDTFTSGVASHRLEILLKQTLLISAACVKFLICFSEIL